MFSGRFICSIIAVAVSGAPASAQLIKHRDLSLATALTIATTAADHCKGQGYAVSVAVLGREAQIIVQLRGDSSPPHSIENSYRRAYTALTYRQPSANVEKRVRAEPGDQLVPELYHACAGRTAHHRRRRHNWCGGGLGFSRWQKG